MRRIVLALGMLSLCGCAARVFEVPLSPPADVSSAAEVRVHDGRLDPQVYITVINIGATAINLLAPNPTLDVALKSFIQDKLPPSYDGQAISVNIERLDLKDKVGFAKADELYCELESTLTQGDSNKQTLVRTFSKNGENLSPFIYNAAKLILDQCLEQHAQQLVAQLEKAPE